MQRLLRGEPAKEKLGAKALKVPTIKPASVVLFLEWNRLWEPMEPADLKRKGLLDPNGGIGGKFEGGFGGNVGGCGGNGGRGGSIAEKGGGSLVKRSMESKDGLGGGGFVVLEGRSSNGWVGAGGGEVKGGGVDFGVSRTLLGEIPREIMGENGGEVFGVDGGAV
ncbi:hypothetical protein Tco_0511165 [Tanacetum coccineum]